MDVCLGYRLLRSELRVPRTCVGDRLVTVWQLGVSGDSSFCIFIFVFNFDFRLGCVFTSIWYLFCIKCLIGSVQ